MAGTTHTDDDGSMEQRLADAGATLDRLSATASELGGAVRDQAQHLLAQLRRERDLLARKLEELRAEGDEARQEYRERLDRARKRLEADLAVAEAELRRRRAETREEFAETVDEELEAWRTRIDELRVEAELARMDTRDELQPVIESMHRRRGALEQRLRELREASGDAWRSIRDDIADSLAGLRRSLREADEELTD